MTSSGYLSFLDYSGEPSTMSIITGDITAVSLPGFLTQWGTLRNAVTSIINGTISGEAAYVFKTKLDNALPSSPNAQRERKWLVTYEDNLPFFDDPINAIPNAGYRKIFNFEIPTANPTALGMVITPGTDLVDLTSALAVAFVDAFEDIGRSPYGGTVTVLRISLVGRNL